MDDGGPMAVNRLSSIDIRPTIYDQRKALSLTPSALSLHNIQSPENISFIGFTDWDFIAFDE
jgi:hypothetical protein